jgi:hypothetical protein
MAPSHRPIRWLRTHDEVPVADRNSAKSRRKHAPPSFAELLLPYSHSAARLLAWMLVHSCEELRPRIIKYHGDLRSENSSEPPSLVTQIRTAITTTDRLRFVVEDARQILAVWRESRPSEAILDKLCDVVDVLEDWLKVFERAVDESLRLDGLLSLFTKDERAFANIPKAVVEEAFQRMVQHLDSHSPTFEQYCLLLTEFIESIRPEES